MLLGITLAIAISSICWVVGLLKALDTWLAYSKEQYKAECNHDELVAEVENYRQKNRSNEEMKAELAELKTQVNALNLSLGARVR